MSDRFWQPRPQDGGTAIRAGEPLLQVRDLRTEFLTQDGIVHAVNGISYTLREGEALGIVGESGCGKSVGALSVMRLIPTPPGRIAGGGPRAVPALVRGADDQADVAHQAADAVEEPLALDGVRADQRPLVVVER